MNERNVCVGDIVSVGPSGSDPDSTLLLQVSLPRQPCFKLNHRFGLRNFAPNTYRLSRTGWYYRVVRPGTVQAGDEIRLISRPNPRWTIERVQEYLHRNTGDHAANAELAEIKELGEESRGMFRARVAKVAAQERKEKRGGSSKRTEDTAWKNFRIVNRTMQTPRIASIILEPVTPEDRATTDAETPIGLHARLRLPSGLVRAYSLVSFAPDRLEIGIALAEPSRGASKWLHSEEALAGGAVGRDSKNGGDGVEEEEKKEGKGSVVQIGRITTDVKRASAASKHVFVAGGIGITAFLAMIAAYDAIHWDWTLHYAVRSPGDIPFRDRLDALPAERIVYYDSSAGQRLNVADVIAKLPWNSHLYVCGPPSLMAALLAALRAPGSGLTEDDVHFEAFSADMSGDPFEAEVVVGPDSPLPAAVAQCGVLRVAEDETLLEVLRRELGPDAIGSSCEVGNCGTCKVGLHSGVVDHRGTALTEEEKKNSMLACVSRGVGKIVVEI